MDSHFNDPNTRSWELPSAFKGDDVRLSEDVLERYIQLFTEPGDIVLDPFAGFGTSLLVAERMGRIGLGYEILSKRAEYANSILAVGEVRVGDIRGAELTEVSCNLVISSPPYMNRTDTEDPLKGYQTLAASYEQYIAELASIYVRLGETIAANGRLVIQLQNLRNEEGVTPLVFDLVGAIGEGLDFEREDVTIWEKSSYGYTHGYCLIFRPA